MLLCRSWKFVWFVWLWSNYGFGGQFCTHTLGSSMSSSCYTLLHSVCPIGSLCVDYVLLHSVCPIGSLHVDCMLLHSVCPIGSFCVDCVLLHSVFPIGSLCVDDDDIVPIQPFEFMHLVVPCRIDNF